eukprot:1450586-Rhodomonas_salina.3
MEAENGAMYGGNANMDGSSADMCGRRRERIALILTEIASCICTSVSGRFAMRYAYLPTRSSTAVAVGGH